MGEEKLDNTVYTIRGLRDLADMAASQGGPGHRRAGRNGKAAGMEARFDGAWWFGSSARQYADSLDDPGNTKVFQRHWIGVTPVEAEIAAPGSRPRPLAPLGHARALVEQRETACYTGEYGLFHTGTGADDGHRGQPRPVLRHGQVDGAGRASGVHPEHLDHGGCRGSARPDGRRPSSSATRPATPGPARPDRVGDARRDAGDRALAGLRPREHRQEVHRAFDGPAGVGHLRDPVAGRALRSSASARTWAASASPSSRRSPPASSRSRVSDIRVGTGLVNVTALRGNNRLATIVRQDRRHLLTVGALLPEGKHVKAVTVDGRKATFRVLSTARGREVRVNGGREVGRTVLVVTLR